MGLVPGISKPRVHPSRAQGSDIGLRRRRWRPGGAVRRPKRDQIGFLGSWSPNSRQVALDTLPQIDMEADRRPFIEDSSFIRGPSPLPG